MGPGPGRFPKRRSAFEREASEPISLRRLRADPAAAAGLLAALGRVGRVVGTRRLRSWPGSPQPLRRGAERSGACGPASVFPHPPKRLGTLGQRAGPVRLKPPSPLLVWGFPRRRVPWPDEGLTNEGFWQVSGFGGCGQPAAALWVSLWIAVDGWNSHSRIKGLSCPLKG